jgi:hypothetical protein
MGRTRSQIVLRGGLGAGVVESGHGHEPVRASGGGGTRSSRFRVALVEVRLPHRNGTVADQLLGVRPLARVLFCRGTQT